MLRTALLSACVILAGLAALKLLVLFLEPRLAFYPMRGLGATPREVGVRYRNLRIRTADGETVVAWWLPHPRPRAEVIFWHGNGGNLSLWLDVIAGIEERGLSVLALDYRGYGESTGSPSEQGVYRDTDALVARFRSELHEPGVPVLYWGRSLGAAAAAYASTVAPPDGLILESAFADGLSVVRGDPVMAVLSLFSTYRFPTATFLRGYGGPVLLLHGDADRVVPVRHGRDLFQQLGGPKRLVVIRGADHENLHTADPETYWRAVDELLDEARAESAPR
jgi:hypothetical protein